MTFEEFCQYCSCDCIQDEENRDTTNVLVIFSQAWIKNFSSDFVKHNPEVARKLTMHDLYGYIKEQFDD